MKVRSLLTFTAIVSSILGAIVAYLVLSVPNDLRADALLKQARQQITEGDQQKGRESLSRIVQQYPRTDAAAAATVALVTLADSERAKLQKSVETLTIANRQNGEKLAALETSFGELKNAPPKVVTVQAPPPPAPAAVKKAPPKKKTTPKKRTTTKRRRR